LFRGQKLHAGVYFSKIIVFYRVLDGIAGNSALQNGRSSDDLKYWGVAMGKF